MAFKPQHWTEFTRPLVPRPFTVDTTLADWVKDLDEVKEFLKETLKDDENHYISLEISYAEKG